MDQHMAAIAELRERVRSNTEDIERHDQHLQRLDETVADMRAMLAGLATKDDIAELRKDVGETFRQQLRDAQNSVPGRVGLLFAGAMFLIALVDLVARLAPHAHG